MNMKVKSGNVYHFAENFVTSFTEEDEFMVLGPTAGRNVRKHDYEYRVLHKNGDHGILSLLDVWIKHGHLKVVS